MQERQQKALNWIADHAGYMILCDDPDYHTFWVRPNGDVIGPKEQLKEARRLCQDVVCIDMHPSHEESVMALLDILLFD